MNPNNSFPNSLYPPFGTNDNNFNRRGVPSNIYPKNGANTGNPTGRYNPMTTNNQMKIHGTPSMSSFDEAFSKTSPIIEKIDYTNKNELLHNNVGDTVIDEHIIEYRINIDSMDRDISAYPDPFSFVVKFNPPGRNIVQQEVYIDPNNKSKGTKIQETLINGPPRPHINKEFRNVKYIKLENVILPQFTRFTEDPDGKTKFDCESSLIAERYVGLIIKEIENNANRTYTTGDDVTKYDESTGKMYTPKRPFAIIIPDKNLINYFSGLPYYGSKTYKSSALGNISQLSIEFADSFGKPLKYEGLYTPKEIKQRELDNDPIPTSDIRHPLNRKLQVHLSFVIGVVESQINNNTKYELY